MTALTDKTFIEFVTANRLAIVHFWAPWNSYDQQMSSFLETELSPGLRNRVTFGSFNTDEPGHLDLCKALHVMGLPFVALYRDGVLFKTVTGMHRQAITSLIEELVADEPRAPH